MTAMIYPHFFPKAVQGRVKNMFIAFVKSQARTIKQDWNIVLQQYLMAAII